MSGEQRFSLWEVCQVQYVTASYLQKGRMYRLIIDYVKPFVKSGSWMLMGGNIINVFKTRFSSGFHTLLSENSRHSSLRPFRVIAGRVAFFVIPTCRELGPMRFVECIAVVLEISSIGSQIGVAYNKHVIHCTSKSYKLSEPTGSNQWHLSNKIMTIYVLNFRYIVQ